MKKTRQELHEELDELYPKIEKAFSKKWKWEHRTRVIQTKIDMIESML